MTFNFKFRNNDDVERERGREYRLQESEFRLIGKEIQEREEEEEEGRKEMAGEHKIDVIFGTNETMSSPILLLHFNRTAAKQTEANAMILAGN